ncbi:MAG: DUF483 domain-containing protein [Candidatus Aenigmarchaeota archaeon]|nr:DUF483 domain-containing protein [Candidatus Aenigmarchaeota archaeon]
MAVQEFLLVVNDVKPVLRFSPFSDENLNELKGLCNTYGLCMTKAEAKMTPRKPNENIYISKSMDLAKKAREAERNRDIKELGMLLGYPECCVKFFVEIANTMVNRIPYIIITFLHTKDKPSFYTNNIFNSQSRGSKYKSEITLNKKLHELEKYFLISHVPCSYKCKDSIKIGKETLKILKDEIPDFASEIISKLKRIFLVFSDFEFAIFDGVAKENEIKYTNMVSINCRDENKFREGNKIIIGDKDIQIFRNDNIFHTIKRKNRYDGVVMDFT